MAGGVIGQMGEQRVDGSDDTGEVGKPDLLPVVFCLMVRIFRLMLVLLYI